MNLATSYQYIYTGGHVAKLNHNPLPISSGRVLAFYYSCDGIDSMINPDKKDMETAARYLGENEAEELGQLDYVPGILKDVASLKIPIQDRKGNPLGGCRILPRSYMSRMDGEVLEDLCCDLEGMYFGALAVQYKSHHALAFYEVDSSMNLEKREEVFSVYPSAVFIGRRTYAKLSNIPVNLIVAEGNNVAVLKAVKGALVPHLPQSF